MTMWQILFIISTNTPLVVTICYTLFPSQKSRDTGRSRILLFRLVKIVCRVYSVAPCLFYGFITNHYDDVIMSSMASQITSLTIIYSTVYSGTDQRKHQSSASLAFVQGIHRGPVNSPQKWPVTRKMFPFDDVIMYNPWWDDSSNTMSRSKGQIHTSYLTFFSDCHHLFSNLHNTTG